MDYLKPDDKLYFLGDCCDRGDDGVKIFNELTSDPRVTFLLGNHEQMMMDAIPHCIRGLNERNYISDDSYECNIWFSNGGMKTAQAFYDMTIQEIHDIRKKIKEMPTKVEYVSPAGYTVILEHAGYSPFITPHRTHDPVWDRKHFNDEWYGNWGDRDVDPAKVYLVHGHTPVQYLQFEFGYKDQPPKTKKDLLIGKMWDSPELVYKPEIIRYCDNHKFDIDCCTVASDRVALLDLDTFEVKYFDGDEA
jgi:serine/threonine protein phosphatase 1